MCIQLKPPFSRHKGIGVQFTDEPTGNLDHQNGLEVMSLLKRSVEEFCLTLIVVTHDPAIASMADRVITLSDGVLISDAKVKHALSSDVSAMDGRDAHE